MPRCVALLVLLAIAVDTASVSDMLARTSPSRPTQPADLARGGGKAGIDMASSTSIAEIVAKPDGSVAPAAGPVSSHGRDDGDDAADQAALKGFRLPLRVACLLWAFALPLLTAALAYLSTFFREKFWYGILANSIAMSGAAFIKWGQWAAVRPDMFPEGLCRALSRLHSSAPTHAYSHSEARIKTAFGGREVSEVFDWFGREPLASGSIAQVHKAVLGGRVVAVKVRHPFVKERMDLDFRIMRGLADAVDKAHGLKWMNLGPSMEQFSHTMGAQTRLDIEALHLDIFNSNFRKWSDCNFPTALFRTEDVLVETYEEGFLVSEYAAAYQQRRRRKNQQSTGSGGQLASAAAAAGAWTNKLLGRKPEHHQYDDLAPPDPQLAHFIVAKGEDMYLKMLLVDNLMHADLHPGNILVHAHSDGIQPPRLVLVDAGMVAVLVRSEQDNFIGLLECMGLGDGAEAANLLLKFSAKQTCVDPVAQRAFRDDMTLLFGHCCRGYHTGVDVGEVLRGALAIIRRHQVRVDVNYATLIMNVLCLDGLAKDLMPEYNIMDAAKPLLEAHRRLTRLRGGTAIFLLWMPVAQMLKRRRDKNVMQVLGREAAAAALRRGS